MRIIDFHTHYYPNKIVERALAVTKQFFEPVTNGTRQGVIDSMKRNNIYKSVALPIVTSLENTLSVNMWAANENHDEICMLGSIHPDDENYLQTLTFIKENNMRGIKLHSEYQNFLFDDLKMARIFDACIELNLFVITHCGFDIMYSAPFRCTPKMLKDVHLRHPKLKLIGAHMGGMRMFDEVEKELLGLPIYLDLSFMTDENISFERLQSMIERHDLNYILFGSDSPWCEPKRVIDIVNQLDISNDNKVKIFATNAEKLLKLAL